MPDIETSDATLDGGTSTESTVDSGTTQEQREYFDANKHIPKSEFTKLRQRDAEERQKFESEYQSRQSQLAARESQLIQAALMLQQRYQGQGQHQAQDPYSKLREQPYVTGSDLADIVQQMRDNDFGGVAQAIRQRDQALGLLHQRLSELQKSFDGIRGKNTEGEFENRLRKVQSDLGLPDEPWASEFLKDVYLSHEGADLNDEFPNLARTRLEDLRKAIRAMDKAAAEKARKLPILASGGQGTPSKPFKDDGKYKSPKQRTDELFDAFLKD